MLHNGLATRLNRLFQCGALLTRHKTGNTPLDKQGEEYEVIETIEHLMKYCKNMNVSERIGI